MLLIDFCAFPFNPLLRLHIVYIFLAISLTRILINCGTDWEVPLNVAVLGHKLIKGLGSAKAVFFFHCAYNKCRLINVKSIFYWYQLLSNIGLSSESRLNYLFIGWHQLTPSKSIRDISQDNYNVRRLYKRATKMASLSIPHSNFLFLGQFQYWSTHYQLRSMARYVTPVHNHKRSYIDSCIPAEACGLQDDVIVLCLTSWTTPRRRNLLVALAQYIVTDFWS